MLGKVIQKWSILKSLHVPEMKGQLEAKNDTTGTISQFTVHRTHMRKVISANAEFTIEIIQHVRKKKNRLGEPENKTYRKIR